MKIWTITAVIGSALMIIGASAPARPDDTLARAVRVAIGSDGEARFTATRRDLNGDGRAEIVAYVIGSDVCGSGGCPLLVLSSRPGGYRTIVQTSVTQLPVRLLPSRHHGWNDLAVGVHGGGARPHLARLIFDGRSYPDNPTIVPTEASRTAGVLLLAQDAPLTPLPR